MHSSFVCCLGGRRPEEEAEVYIWQCIVNGFECVIDWNGVCIRQHRAVLKNKKGVFKSR